MYLIKNIEMESVDRTLDQYRATGRTFRKILNALERASTGKDVWFICDDNRMIEHTRHKMFSICNTYFNTRFTHDKNGGRTSQVLKFEGSGGSVCFVGAEYWFNNNDFILRGRDSHNYVVIDDVRFEVWHNVTN